MDSMDKQKAPGMMAKLRNSKGFSLIEMAIVLVIIGIIIAAIIKGQDLLLNSRAKQVTTAMNAWKIAAFGYMDRNGRFPGDAGKSGLIMDTEGNTQTAIVDVELNGNMAALPTNPVMVGGNAFWIYFGTADSDTTGRLVNTLTICKTATCDDTIDLTSDEMELIKTVDTAIDGAADQGLGSFRALVTSANLVNAASTISAGGRADRYASAASIVHATGVWSTTGHFGAVWAFEKPF